MLHHDLPTPKEKTITTFTDFLQKRTIAKEIHDLKPLLKDGFPQQRAIHLTQPIRNKRLEKPVIDHRLLQFEHIRDADTMYQLVKKVEDDRIKKQKAQSTVPIVSISAMSIDGEMDTLSKQRTSLLVLNEREIDFRSSHHGKIRRPSAVVLSGTPQSRPQFIHKSDQKRFAESMKQAITQIEAIQENMKSNAKAFEARMASVYDYTKMYNDMDQSDAFSTSNVIKDIRKYANNSVPVFVALERVRKMILYKEKIYHAPIPVSQHFTINPARAWQKVRSLMRAIYRLLVCVKDGQMQKSTNDREEVKSIIGKIMMDVTVGEQICTLTKSMDANRNAIFKLNRIITNKNRAFSKMTYQKRMRCCRRLWFESHPTGKIVIKEGQQPRYVYFIVSGQVQILKTGLDGPVEAGVLTSGASFGRPDVATSMQAPRKATIICTSRTDFVVMDIDDFNDVIMETDTQVEMDERMRLFSDIPLFHGQELSVIEHMVANSELRYFDQGSTIIGEGSSNKYLYFLVSGHVQMSKSIPLILQKDKKRNVYIPDETRDLKQYEERTEQKIVLGQVDVHQSFPEPLPMSLMHFPENAEWDKVSLMSKITDLDALGQNMPYASFRAITPSVCLLIERVQFLKMATPQMLATLMDVSKIYQVSTQEIQQEWINAKGWENYKTNVVSDTLKLHVESKKLSRMRLETEMRERAT